MRAIRIGIFDYPGRAKIHQEDPRNYEVQLFFPSPHLTREGIISSIGLSSQVYSKLDVERESYGLGI